MPILDRLAYFVIELSPLVALPMLVLGVMLLRRGTDRAVWFLIGWSVLRLATDAWGFWVKWYYFGGTDRLPPPAWVNAISALCLVLGQLFLYVLAGYAVYRLWQPTQSRRG